MQDDSKRLEARERARPGGWPARAVRSAIAWVVTGPHRQPPEIEGALLRQSLTKARPLVVSVLSSSLMALIAALMTDAPWAYGWFSAELLIGGLRLWLTGRLAKAEALGRRGNTSAPIFAGFAAFAALSTGSYLCVASGEWPLIVMAGIGIASLVGAVSSRNAGTPRYGFLLICILTLPFAVAALRSPLPFLFVVGIQLPLYASGVIFVMLENYKVLLHLHHSERENRRLAQHDLLTGLPNRALNLQRFDELLASLRGARGNRMRRPFTVFCLDLDGFKDVNDRFGHAAGDAVLVAVATRLRESVRELDLVSRIGGDEFVILLPGISPEEASAIAERIIATVAAPFDVGAQATVAIGISIGAASAPADGETADALLRSADRALYEAKIRGKNLFVTYRAASGAGLVPEPDADSSTGTFGEQSRYLDWTG